MKSLTPEIIIDYWHSDRIRKQWFNSTPELDDEIRNQFEPVWQAAARGDLDQWKGSAEGCLALCIILDQFPLNMYRGEARSFETESNSIKVSKHAIDTGLDKALPSDRLIFLYMPLMHSESMDDQEQAIELYETAGLEENAGFARHHRDIVKRFRRFPHRNTILGRESSPAEQEYMNSDEAFKG